MKGFRNVSITEFFMIISGYDITVTLLGSYPDWQEFRLRDGTLIGKVTITPVSNTENWPPRIRYYILNEWEQSISKNKNNLKIFS